jgi:hypothetical protein
MSCRTFEPTRTGSKNAVTGPKPVLLPASSHADQMDWFSLRTEELSQVQVH